MRDGDFKEVIEPGYYLIYGGGHQPGDSNGPGKVLPAMFVVTGDAPVLVDSCNMT